MALLFFDGFEGLAVGGTITQRYNSGSGHISTSPNPASPSGGSVLRYNNSSLSNVIHAGKTAAAHASGFVGVRILLADTAQPHDPGRAIGLNNVSDGVEHLSFLTTALNAIQVRRGGAGGTILGTSANNVLAIGVWKYVEIGYTINDTTGAVTVRVDGVNVIELTSIDTRNGGATSLVDQLAFYNTGAASPVRAAAFDDVYWADTGGSSPYNTYLGDVRVIEMIPDAAGDSTQFTPNAGANWDRNDETPGHDSDTTYVESSTAGHKDLYSTVNPATSATTIYAAKVVCVARKTDAGDQSLEFGVKAGTTESFGTATNLTDSYAEYTNTLLTNPDTAAAWTTAGLNGTQVGFRIPV